jgi:hypothetical protein
VVDTLIKRYFVLTEGSEQIVPVPREEYTMSVLAVADSSSQVEQLTFIVTAVDATWGPNHTRIEGFIHGESSNHAVVGYYATSDVPEDRSGIIEVHFNDA